MKRKSNGTFGVLIDASTHKGDEFDVQVDKVTSPVVKKALEAQKAKDAELVQAQIIEALDQSRALRASHVNVIRHLRKTVESHKTALDKLDAAEKTATDTGDFRPLLAALGHNVPDFKGESLTCDSNDINDTFSY